MSAVVPFDGELDAPTPAPAAAAPAAAAKVVPFDGELDAPAAPSEAGAGRGMVNPPLATEPQPEPVRVRDVGLGEGMYRDMRLGQSGMGKTVGLALAAIPTMAEEVWSGTMGQYFGGGPQTGVTDAVMGTLVAPSDRELQANEFKPGEQRSVGNRVTGALTRMITVDLPAMLGSGGETAPATLARGAQPVVQVLREALEHGLKASRPVMINAATEKADQVLKAGGDEKQAVISGLTAAMSTAVQNSVALSVPGKLFSRVAGGGIVGGAMGEGNRVIQNIADPEKLHREFDPAELAVSAATGSVLSGVMGERSSPRQLDRIDLGYDPWTAKKPVDEAVQGMGEGPSMYRGPEPSVAQPAREQGVDAIFKAGTVEEAAAAASRVVREGVDAGVDTELNKLRPLRPSTEGAPDVSAADAVPGVPSGADRLGGDDAVPGVVPPVGDRDAGRAGVDAAGDRDGAAPVAAPVGTGGPLELKTRPYNEGERAQADSAIASLNAGLERSNADRIASKVGAPDEPAQVLQGAPTADMVRARQVARLFGLPVTFIEPHAGFNGVHIEGHIFISPQEKHPVLAVMGHEVLHGVMSKLGGEQAQALRDRIAPFLKPEAVQARLDAEPHRGREHATEEAIADLNGSMWMDPKFWQAVREQDPHAFRQLAYRFMELAATVHQKLGKVSRFQAEKFTTDVDTVRRILAEQHAMLAKEEGVERLSPNEKVEFGVRKATREDLDDAQKPEAKQGGDASARPKFQITPEQIKSATGNKGTFDDTKKDIRFSRKENEDRRAQGLPTREVQVNGKWRPIEDSTGRVIGNGDFLKQQAFYKWFSPGPQSVLAGASKASVDGLKRDAEKLADFLEGGAVGAKFGGEVEIPTSVLQQVVRVAGVHPEVARAIVSALPVQVVDFLGRQKGSPEQALHDESVLKHLLSTKGDARVALGIDEPAVEQTVRVVAKAAAELSGLTAGAAERNAAVLARKFGVHGDIMRGVGDSKVADEQGRPLVVYRGSMKDSGVIDGVGYFTADPAYASQYAEDPSAAKASDRAGGNVIPAYLSMKNPLVMTSEQYWEQGINKGEAAEKALVAKAKADGHDGIIVRGFQDNGAPTDMFITTDSAQVKSAIGNDGTYSPTNPDIRFSRSTAAPAGLPAAAPSSRWERSKAVVSDLIDEGLSRSGVYRMTAPMSEGTARAKAVAQNFANAERRARDEWNSVASYIEKNFDQAQREKMWNAADEENDILAGREPRTATNGLASLDAKQRALVNRLHIYGEELLQRARDVGMFNGEGVPYWTPRMMVMLDQAGEFQRPQDTTPGKKTTSGGEGRNVFTASSNLKQRKYLSASETAAAMQAKGGELVRDIYTMPMAMARLERAIAGRELINQIKELGKATGQPLVLSKRHEGFFTLDHGSFTIWQPRFEKDPATGKMKALLDENGEMVFDRVPLYISKEFEGPVKSILTQQDGPLYRAFMLLKSKAMSAIMFSPLIHNMVIFGRALGYNPTFAGTIALYVKGYTARKDRDMVRLAIDHGMVPMGYNKNGMLDITDVARGFGREGGPLDPNESLVAHGAGALFGLVNKKLGANVKGGIDTFGQFWHGTLLWDRIADLQMGIFQHAHDRLVRDGFSDNVASTLAAHWANRYAGAVGRENMSAIARKTANVLLFSRSFNMGNIGTIKDLFTGMPEGLRGKILHEANAEAASAFTEARKKAWGAFVADTAIALIGLMLAQSAVDKLKKEKGWDEIFGGYTTRAQRMWQSVKDKPLSPAAYNPLQLSPTFDNEPGKQDRIDFGEIPDQGARHQYMRLPTGKVVEDLFHWMLHPAETFSSKMSPIAKAVWQVIQNDKGYDVPVFDPNGSAGKAALDAAAHLAKAQMPWDTIVTAWDKMHGKTTAIENDKLVGQVTGFTWSQGHPGGPEAGVYAQAEERLKLQRLYAMEEVKRLLRYDQEDKARARLEEIGLSPKEVSTILKRLEKPKEGMSRSQQRKFNQHSTEDDQRRMDAVTR